MKNLDLNLVKRLIELAVGGDARLTRVLGGDSFHVQIKWNKDRVQLEHDYIIENFELRMMGCNINSVITGSFLDRLRKAP